MRYLLVVVCALTVCGFIGVVVSKEPAVTVYGNGAVIPYSAPEFARAGRNAVGILTPLDVPVLGVRWDAGSTGSRHISTADLGGLVTWADGAWQDLVGVVRTWFDEGMQHTPALILGLLLLILVPPLAVFGWFFRWVGANPDLTQRVRVVGETEGQAPALDESPTARFVFARDAQLVLDVPGSGGSPPPFVLDHEDIVVRIGREDDNEIQIRDKTVHRYHAAIERSEDGGIAISDLSSRSGNGVTVNGERVARAQLRDGDRIGLGAVSLVFQFKPQ